MMKRLLAVTATTAALAVALPLGTLAPAGASPDDITHLYAMNENPGASTMSDTGSTPVDGSVGDAVDTGIEAEGITGYRFPYLRPNTPPVVPGHLVSIPDGRSVDPLGGDYSITVRYRSGSNFGNLIQKGQSAAAGGQVKIQLPKGRPSCYFKGSAGRVGIGAKTSIADGQFHVLTCTRTNTATELYVDGVRVGRKKGVSGYIDNKAPITIGGKPNCDQVKVTCDYFVGLVDYVQIKQG